MRKAEYQKIGDTGRGEAIYQNLEAGVLYIEIDHERLVKASAESLEGAEFKEMRKKMKIYKGKRRGEGVGGRLIVVQDNGEEYPLQHIERHSPDGFNWGFSGSGPADTALSILTDCLGMGQANQLYQLFKWEIVAGWGDEWSISEEKIREWVEREKETRISLEQDEEVRKG